MTWNASALLAKDPRKRRAKLCVLDRVLLSAAVVFLQEVHGTREEPQLAFFRYEIGEFDSTPGQIETMEGLPFS